MSDLVLDPPTSPNPSPLRLVSSTGVVARRDRYRSVANLGGSARSLYSNVLAHALHNGRRLNPDALRVVLCVKQSRTAGPLERITAQQIWQLLFVDVIAWCRTRRLSLPHGCAAALEALVDYLADVDGLDPASDPVQALHGAIDECTGGWADEPPQPPRPRRSVRSMGGTEPK